MSSKKLSSPWKALGLALLVGIVCLSGLATGALYVIRGLVQKPARTIVSEQPPAPRAKTLAQALGELPRDPSQQAVATPPAPRKAGRAAAGEDLFRDATVPHLEIELPLASKLRLIASPRTYVRAHIREKNIVYTNVAIRLKGGPGSFQRLHDTPSFTVNFDKYTPGQTFHGLKKIHLNSSVQDRTWLNEKISRELFDAAGVPVPRAGHAMLTLPGRNPRLYVLLEGVNKQFMKRYFDDADGNVYDGHAQTDVTDDLPLNTGEEDSARLQDLAAAAQEPDLGKRLEQLEGTLDLDRFLSFMAMEMMLMHWDGYTMHPNNYRIAHNRDTDRMVFIPQGMDQVFGSPRQPLLSPAPAGLVARAVLRIPEMRERYRDRVADLATNVFQVSAITNRIWAVSQRIVLALESVDPQRAREFRDRIAPEACRKVQERARNIQREIRMATRPNRFRFDRTSTVHLTDWASQVDAGEAHLSREKDQSGIASLYISTDIGCTASGRTTVILPAGSYQLEARIKTGQVEFDAADARAGAGLRISRHRLGQKNLTQGEWLPIHFTFEVEQDGEEKVLICELRANKGEAWFDVESLRLKRL